MQEECEVQQTNGERWMLECINIANIESLTQAIDDDCSGYDEVSILSTL